MLIDVHCHLNLYLNLDEIINEANQAGVKKIIAVAMSSLSQKRILEIAEEFDSVYPALGIHPEEVEMNKNIETELESISDLIISNQSHLCAIGEIGMDHYFIKNKNLYPLQTKIFTQMLSLAQKLNLPINVHSKGAETLIFEMLPSYKVPNVNIHWYSGPEKYIKLGLDRGYYFSITPAVKYSPAMKKTVTLVDLDHLLLESDGPVKFRGKSGTPTMVKEVLNEVATIKKEDVKELGKKIWENTTDIFPRIHKPK
ncbi:MAG: TatD family hydrolase [Candidatus Thorarchaeota archaeon]